MTVKSDGIHLLFIMPLLVFLMFFFWSSGFSYIINVEALPGSAVYFNGKLLGVVKDVPTRFEVYESSQGTLKILKSGYTDFSSDISFIGIEASVVAEQVPLSKLVVKSDLNDLFLEFEYNGKIEILKIEKCKEIELPYTVKQILLRSEGYHEKVVMLDMKPFSKEELNVDLVGLDEVILNSFPEGAEVFIENVKVGVTPLKIKKYSLNKIILKKEGYVEKSLENIPVNDKIIVELKKGVDIFVDSYPKDAGVFLNDKYAGTTPFYGIFEPGYYTLTVSKLGYESKEMKIELSEQGVNKYFIELKETKKLISLLNSHDFEFNIDGRYLGKNINHIFLMDDSKHFVKLSSKNGKIEFLMDRNFLESERYLDLQRISSVNVYSINEKVASFLGKTQNIPAFFVFHTIDGGQFVNVRTISKTLSVFVEPSNSQDIFVDKDFGVLFVTTNVKNPLVYIDNKFVPNDKLFAYPLKPGVHEVEVRYLNEVKSQKVVISEGEKIFANFDFDIKIPVNIVCSGGKFIINSQEYFANSQLLYLKSGPNVFSDGMTSIVLLFTNLNMSI